MFSLVINVFSQINVCIHFSNLLFSRSLDISTTSVVTPKKIHWKFSFFFFCVQKSTKKKTKIKKKKEKKEEKRKRNPPDQNGYFHHGCDHDHLHDSRSEIPKSLALFENQKSGCLISSQDPLYSRLINDGNNKQIKQKTKTKTKNKKK